MIITQEHPLKYCTWTKANVQSKCDAYDHITIPPTSPRCWHPRAAGDFQEPPPPSPQSLLRLSSTQSRLFPTLTSLQTRELFAACALVSWFVIPTHVCVTHMPVHKRSQKLRRPRRKPAESRRYRWEPSIPNIPPHGVTARSKSEFP